MEPHDTDFHDTISKYGLNFEIDVVGDFGYTYTAAIRICNTEEYERLYSFEYEKHGYGDTPQDALKEMDEKVRGFLASLYGKYINAMTDELKLLDDAL